MDNRGASDDIWTIESEHHADARRPHTMETTTRPPTVKSLDRGGDYVHRLAGNLNPGYVGVQSRFHRKYYKKTLLGFLIILVIVLLIIIVIVLNWNHKDTVETCRSKECIRAAANLISAMDDQADPCEDFYRFTCGHWQDEHTTDSLLFNDYFAELQAKVNRRLRHFLQATSTTEAEAEAEPAAVTKAKDMYRSCMNVTLLYRRGIVPLLQFLEDIQLPAIPSALNLTAASKGDAASDNGNDFSWLHSTVLIKKNLGLDLIFGFDIWPDFRNRDRKLITLGSPASDFFLPLQVVVCGSANDISISLNCSHHEASQFLLKEHRQRLRSLDGVDSDEEDANDSIELNYMTKMLRIYLKHISVHNAKDEDDDDSQHVDVDVDTDADAYITSSVLRSWARNTSQLSRRLYTLREEAQNAAKTFRVALETMLYLSVDDLQNRTDEWIAPRSLPLWKDYLQLLMADTVHEQPFATQPLTIFLTAADLAYLQAVTELLDGTPTSVIESYLWWNVVREMMPHVSNAGQHANADYMQQIGATTAASSLSLYCTRVVGDMMGVAASYPLANADFLQTTLPAVQQMLTYIRFASAQLIESNVWMDVKSKRATLEKTTAMGSYIGFPPWLLNATALNLIYEPLSINASTFLENMIAVLRWRMQDMLDDLERPYSSDWGTTPSEVNAYYSFEDNAITVPIAILQYPFYNLGLEALNYGSIGTTLGHEMTHGFDDSGRLFNKDGNVDQWWSNETINEYLKHSECYVHQYSRYHLADIDKYIDGELTLDENIADNGGIRKAYHGYRLYIEQNGPEKQRLPGLEKYTPEQLFFMAYGNQWCEMTSPMASRVALEDPHCPGRVRLMGVLSNSREFADVFQCGPNSAMNAAEKCNLW